MVSQPCFANCVHVKDGDCTLEVIGTDRLLEVECACEYYKAKQVSGPPQVLSD